MLSVPVLSGSIAYAVSETLNLREGLSLKFFQAPGFYAIIAFCSLIGAGIDLLGINPIQALYYTSIINGVVAAPLLIILMLIGNNREIMGARVNGRWSNLIGGIAAVAMIVSALALVWSLATGQGS